MEQDPQLAQQIYDSFNIQERILEVPPGTNVQKSRWLIQPKFQTPLLNFADASYEVPPTGDYGDQSFNLITKGLWHQSGSIPIGEAGVFMRIDSNSPNASGSLAEIIGMSGERKRIGELPTEFLLEEAVVAIPFKVDPVTQHRQFIEFDSATYSGTGPNVKDSHTYKVLEEAVEKYVFPPKFDFARYPATSKPIIMYVFEFSATLSQDDISRIWQNLPPQIGERFVTTQAVVEERELIDSLVESSANLSTPQVQWMVFKVKKRAKRDFERLRRSYVSDADLSAFPPAATSDYTYNWPYDYFSLVELAKVEQAVQYVSSDLKQTAPLSPLASLNSNPPVIPAGVGPSVPPQGTSPPPPAPPNPNPADAMDNLVLGAGAIISAEEATNSYKTLRTAVGKVKSSAGPTKPAKQSQRRTILKKGSK